MFAVLRTLPDYWAEFGGRTVELGELANPSKKFGVIDLEAALKAMSGHVSKKAVGAFNSHFGEVIKVDSEGMYDFSVGATVNKESFSFDLTLLADVFGYYLTKVDVGCCKRVKGMCKRLALELRLGLGCDCGLGESGLEI